MSEDLPREVRDLLIRHVESMEQVESLLVLHRAPTRWWTAAEAAVETRGDPKGVERALQHLAAVRLVERDAEGADAYRYAPETPALHRAVELLLQMYNQRPVTLVRALYSRPPSAVRSFADAFRLRPED